jgi:hypothetical protein
MGRVLWSLSQDALVYREGEARRWKCGSARLGKSKVSGCSGSESLSELVSENYFSEDVFQRGVPCDLVTYQPQ